MRTLRFLILLCFPLVSFGQATPVMVADICPGGCSSSPSELVPWNGKVYFFATSPTAGRELHVYDGTMASVVADIAPGTDNGVTPSSALALLNGKLYFAANDTAGATRHYVYAYDGVNAPQKIMLSTGGPLRCRGTLAASGADLLLEYNDTANRYRLAKYVVASGAVQIVSMGSDGMYLGFGSLQVSDDYATYAGQLYSNSLKTHVCHVPTGTVVNTPSSHVSRSAIRPDGVYATFTDLANFGPNAPGLGGTHLSRFQFSPFSWGMLTMGAANATVPYADLSAPMVYNGSVYYAGQTTSGVQNTRPLSLRKYDPISGTTTVVAPLPPAGPTGRRIEASAAINGILYLNYHDSVKGQELFAYNGGSSVLPITDIDGSTAGFNPTSIISYNGNLLIAGTTSTSGTELYRITGTGLGLTEQQQTSATILFPNPATSRVTIALPTTSRYTVRILSTTGQTLRSQTIQGPSASIQIEDLPPGLYFAQITDATTGAPTGTARLVKE